MSLLMSCSLLGKTESLGKPRVNLILVVNCQNLRENNFLLWFLPFSSVISPWCMGLLPRSLTWHFWRWKASWFRDLLPLLPVLLWKDAGQDRVSSPFLKQGRAGLYKFDVLPMSLRVWARITWFLYTQRCFVDLKAVVQETPHLWFSYSLSLNERQECERILKETELY